VVQADCPQQNPLSNGCWVAQVAGTKHDSYFTTEARYLFVYNATDGLTLQFFGDDDLFVFINGVLVLDLGGVHQQMPGQVTVKGASGATQANIVEGGCLDKAGNLPPPTALTYGPTGGGCTPTNSTPPAPVSPDDFRVRTLDLKMDDGKVYEIAIFGADRHPPESNYQLTLNGYNTTKSNCKPRCGDAIVSAGEECDCGDDSATGDLPKGCTGRNKDGLYGGCASGCKWGPFCGDGTLDSPQEQCDLGKDNGANLDSSSGCAFGCLRPSFCGDGKVDTDRGEQCDMGTLNNVKVDSTGAPSDAKDAMVKCDPNCQIPSWVP
jgi:fibro-slime domain-containing protein